MQAEDPFARTIGNFAGLAGAIPDAIVRGTGLVQKRTGTALDLFSDRSTLGKLTARTNRKVVDDYVERSHREIDIRIVPGDRARFGRVPLCADVAEASGIALIGCDAGVNGSAVPALEAIGLECLQAHGIATLTEVVDRVCTRMALRMVDVAAERGMVPPNASIGFTGRAAISGRKPEYILEGIEAMGLFPDGANDHLVFVDDGLARGAALMGRCMLSLGKPKFPLGGRRGGRCIMAKRIACGK